MIGINLYNTARSTILAEKRESNWIYYTYDENGSVIGMKYNNVNYYFQKNTQGDIIRIYKQDGSLLVKYTYDAWGNILSTTDTSGIGLSQINPFRYRSYYYDTESGFYYLNSRYYDPVTSRFINADGQLNDGLFGSNLFAYCNNNPVNNVDYNGRFSLGSLLMGAACVLAAVAVVVTAPVSIPALAAAAGVSTAVATIGVATVAAGATYFAASEFTEAFTGTNPGKEAFGEDLYSIGEATTLVLAGELFALRMMSMDFDNDSGGNATGSRGSTAVKQPSNLKEQLSLEQVKSNPQIGEKIPVKMSDPRWAASDGWIKMQQVLKTSQGNIVIHYVYNEILKIFDEFKIK